MLEVTCPHCDGTVQIERLNCAIFRHGIFKRNGRQIPPHASKADCDRWIAKKEIHGCGRPFKVVDGKAIVCEYI